MHDAHIQTLRTIDVIQGNVPATGALVVPQPRSDPTAAAMPRVTSLSSRVGDAAANVAGPSIGRAAGLSNSMIPTRQRAAAMAPHGSGRLGLSPAGGNTGPSEQPEWIGVMTAQP